MTTTIPAEVVARLGEPWAVREDVDIVAAVSAVPDGDGGRPPVADDGIDGVTLIAVHGLMVPRVSPRLEERGMATDTAALPARISSAVESGAAAIMLHVDSPGGSAAGVPEAAAAVAAAAEQVPVVAAVEFTAASAAYWVASAASAVVASRSAMVGSIGALMVRETVVRALMSMGVDVDVVSAGEGKTDLASAVEFTAAARTRVQAMVDTTYADFVADVAAGRGMRPSAVRDLGATVMDASRAREAGLIDAVGTSGEVLDMLSTDAGREMMTASRRRRRLARA